GVGALLALPARLGQPRRSKHFSPPDKLQDQQKMPGLPSTPEWSCLVVLVPLYLVPSTNLGNVPSVAADSWNPEHPSSQPRGIAYSPKVGMKVVLDQILLEHDEMQPVSCEKSSQGLAILAGSAKASLEDSEGRAAGIDLALQGQASGCHHSPRAS
ncbi:Hypothetical predicted protein, partial [Paramuricea clavata]